MVILLYVCSPSWSHISCGALGQMVVPVFFLGTFLINIALLLNGEQIKKTFSQQWILTVMFPIHNARDWNFCSPIKYKSKVFIIQLRCRVMLTLDLSCIINTAKMCKMSTSIVLKWSLSELIKHFTLLCTFEWKVKSSWSNNITWHGQYLFLCRNRKDLDGKNLTGNNKPDKKNPNAVMRLHVEVEKPRVISTKCRKTCSWNILSSLISLHYGTSKHASCHCFRFRGLLDN